MSEYFFERRVWTLPQVIYVIKNVVVLFLSAVEFAMLARAVLSWIPMEPNKYIDLLHTFTEPFIAPVRQLFYKMNWFRGFPIDMSFLVSYMLISAVVIILSR